MSDKEFEKRLKKGLERASRSNAEPDDTESAEYLCYDLENSEW